jgi:hypothetical protein
MTWTDACVVLGISADASMEEIRTAYRHRMRALHPDRGGADDVSTHDEIAAVTNAWRRLSGDPCDTLGPGSVTAPPETDAGVEAPEKASDDAATLGDGSTPRVLRTVVAIAFILLLAWMAVFMLIAFSQSG